MLSRLSIRIRLTVLFAGVMVVVLLVIGAFVYERVGTSLMTSLDNDLHARATELRTAGAKSRDFAGAEGVAQLLSANGQVLRGTPGLPARSLLTPQQLQAARAGEICFDRAAPASFGDEHWRFLAEPVSGAPEARIAIVASSLKPRDEALEHLLVQLLIAGAAALVLASLAAYTIAAAALRPVEEMSRRAAAISLQRGATRLPVPGGNDEIAKLGARLNEMLERLEAAFSAERRFLADASHELQTPLAILRAELEIALRRPRAREELEEVLRSAQEETDRLGRLAQDLLVVARADEGALPVTLTTIDADDLLSSVAERFERRADETGRTVATEPSPGLQLLCDPIRIGQALDNLIDNSLRYGAGTITLSVRRRASVVELHVRDDGGGFPAAFLARAFDRFSRADGVRSGAGSGLGLAIVRAIAHAHGGDASASNRSEGGSDVWLALPRSTA